MENKKCIFCKNCHCLFSEWDYQKHIWCDKNHKINLEENCPADESDDYCSDYAEVTFADELVEILAQLFIFAVLFGFMALFCWAVNQAQY